MMDSVVSNVQATALFYDELALMLLQMEQTNEKLLVRVTFRVGTVRMYLEKVFWKFLPPLGFSDKEAFLLFYFPRSFYNQSLNLG